MAKIKKDDTVLVIAGKDRGTTGKVLSVDGNRITVEGVNRQKRHTKESTGERGVKVGGIITVEASLHIQMSWSLIAMARLHVLVFARTTKARIFASHVAPERTSNVNSGRCTSKS